MPPPTSKSSPVIIVGAGVFGLSTAYHLTEQGYTNITILDRQKYDQNAYSTSEGADAASADINKVMRLSYGSELLYQKLAFDGIDIWNKWNEQLASSSAAKLPKGLSPHDKIWNNCGFLRLSKNKALSQHETDTLANLEKEGLRDTQYVIGNARDSERARADGLQRKFDPMGLQQRGRSLVGVYDTLGGFVNASKACAWVLHHLQKAGVKMMLGPEKGSVESFIKSGSNRTVGVKTADGSAHYADLVVLAAGPWTPSLYPPVSSLLEATVGSVAFIQLPPRSENPAIWDKYAPENFPVYSWGGWGKGNGLGGFPRTEDGIMKIGYRGTKYTNYATVTERETGKTKRISVPKTAYWPYPSEQQITKQAIDAIKDLVIELFPDLVPFGISRVRNCWYTDSLDNSFLIDWAPGDDGLLICSGGSGHGFKFLPILGREVVNIIEKPQAKNEYGQLWRWRTKEQGPKNGLEDGESGPRVWKNQQFATKKDWKIAESARL